MSCRIRSCFRLSPAYCSIAVFAFLLSGRLDTASAQDAVKKGDATTASSTEPDAKPEADKTKKKAGNKTNERLDVIERALQQIAKDLQTLQKPMAAEPTKPVEPAKPEVKPTAPTVSTPPANQQAARNEPAAPPAPAMKLEAGFLKSIAWRSLGPANMGGRITDLVVHDQDPSLWWIATASGGLLKTTNHGVTVEHQFDREATVSIGAMAVAPTDKNLVWVGTGEANPRNSVSYGDGVYKSTDGGKTWKNMGLKKTYQIGKVLIHPQDANTVFVGALGRLYGPNPDRGVFKTTDGGETWEKILYVDDRTGVIDMIMHPTDPNMIIAALWDRQRDGFDSWPGSVPMPEGVDGYDPLRKWGPGGGLFKTVDGGKTWKKLTNGLPSSSTGRIGIDWQTKSPHAIYAIIDCEDIGKGPVPSTAYLGAVGIDVAGKARINQLLPGSPAEKAGVKVGDNLLAVGDKDIKAFDDLLEILRKQKPRDKVKLKLQRGEETVTIEVELTGRPGTSQPQQGGGPPTGVWLGVVGEDRDGKVILTRITPEAPSEKAGLKEGDAVTTVDGKAVSSYESLIEQVRGHAAGDKLKLNVLRGAETVELVLTLENRPGTPPTPTAASNVYMGIQGQDADSGGALLSDVTDGSPAQKATLEPGDIVQAINGNKIANYEALIADIRTHKVDEKVKITILRHGATKDVELTFAARTDGPTQMRPYTYSYFGQTPNIQDQQGAKGYEYGGVYRSMDLGETWERVNSLNTRPMYFSLIRVDPSDAQRVYVLGVVQFRSDNGGATFTGDFGRGVHADNHDLWIDPNDGRHMVIGGDGGFYTTYDRGVNWDHVNTSAIGQFYHVAISPKQPYWVFGGLQDNGSWGGPAVSQNGGVLNEDWVSVAGGDGFVCRVDPEDPDLVYYESQNGTIGRRHLKTGERASIRPPRSANTSYRFNWNTPFILSNHNSKIFYSAGNYVFRSLDRGNNLAAISPEITLTQRGSASALAESPRNSNLLYVGTDDGALWVTRNGGQDWKNITQHLGIPSPRWVATIEPSRFVEGRVYVCLDGHRSDDDEPYILVSEDFGETFKSVRSNIPWGSTRCLREDFQNVNLLYLGTEFGVWTSLDRGANWITLNTNLPTVAVHEIAVHPTNGEIVAATHGRSLWACDISGLRQLKPEHAATQIALLDPEDVVRWRTDPSRGRTNRRFVGSNPSSGSQLWYALPAKAERVTVRIEDIEGRVVREIRGAVEPGLHRVAWDLIQSTQPRTSEATQGGTRPPFGSGGQRPSPGGRPTGRPGTPPATTGGNPPPATNPATPPPTPPTADPPPSNDAKKPDAATPVEPKSAEAKPADAKPAEPKPDEPKPDEPKPDEPKPVVQPPAAQPPAAQLPAVVVQVGPAGTTPGQRGPGSGATPGSTRRPGGGGGGGFGGGTGGPGGGGARPVSNGNYRAILIVDGLEFPAQIIAVVRDPNAPADAIAEEEAEQYLIEEKLAAEAKLKAKGEGRSVHFDD